MHPLPPAVLSVAISLATQSHAVPTEGKALVCDLSPKGECVPTFDCESERGPFVGEVEKRDERWSEIELLLIVRVHREPGNVCI